MSTLVYGGHLGKWPPTPSGTKSEMGLYPNILKSNVCQISFLYHKTDNSAIFCHVSAGLTKYIRDGNLQLQWVWRTSARSGPRVCLRIYCISYAVVFGLICMREFGAVILPVVYIFPPGISSDILFGVLEVA